MLLTEAFAGESFGETSQSCATLRSKITVALPILEKYLQTINTSLLYYQKDFF
jgi:hypothetical protein